MAVAVGALLFLGVGPAHGADVRPTVYEVSISGPVDPLMARYVDRSLHTAVREHGSLVIVRLDTPGGLDSSMRHIIKAILNTGVPVACWVGPTGARAASAGAFILIGCPVAAMAQGTNTGAAHPVGITGGILSTKVTNDAAAYIRSLAERWGRNADWAERAVRQSVSVPAAEAVSLHVADLEAPTRSALFRAVEGRTVRAADQDVVLHVAGARIAHQHLTLAEGLLHAIIDPDLAYLFFILGLVSLAAFMIHPAVHVTVLV